jgi:Flp pilus assembly protein CpaB
MLSAVDRNEPVLRSKITGAGQRASLSLLLQPGKRAVTVRVDDVRGVAGFVLPGDFVDVVLISEDPAAKRESYSEILLHYVKVLAIDQLTRATGARDRRQGSDGRGDARTGTENSIGDKHRQVVARPAAAGR